MKTFNYLVFASSLAILALAYIFATVSLFIGVNMLESAVTFVSLSLVSFPGLLITSSNENCDVWDMFVQDSL